MLRLRSFVSPSRIGSIIALGLALSLGACSALRLAYPQAGEVAYWWIDGYVDFEDGQSTAARAALGDYMGWHRRTQLPDYATLLSRAAVEVGQDMTGTQACRWFDELRTRADTAVEHALPAAVTIAATFTPEQLAHLKRKQSKTNAEFRDDFLQPDPAERLRKSVDRAIDRTEQLYGRLNDAQRQRLAQGIAASPFDATLWQAERERRQRDLLQILGQLRSAPAAANGAGVGLLRTHWQQTMRSPDPAYAAYQQKLETYNCEFFAEIHNQTTPEQRREAQRRLRGWESDFRRLAAS